MVRRIRAEDSVIDPKPKAHFFTLRISASERRG